MKPSIVFHEKKAEIKKIVLKHGMLNPRLFGSVLHKKDHDGSDLDLLVDAGETTTFFNILEAKEELESLLGVEVDIRTPLGLPESFRERVLQEAAAL